MGPHAEFLIQDIWSETQESAFLTSAQVMLMLDNHEPYFENQSLHQVSQQ